MSKFLNNLPKDKVAVALAAAIFILVGVVIYINIAKQNAVDRSKIPEKVEDHGRWQRWITNLKNKDLEIEADEFRLKEENEIYNTKWMQVYSLDEEGRREEFWQNIENHKNIKKVIFSPSERGFVDYRDISRDGYGPNQVHYYGLRDDKIIDARILDCSLEANCYFDRAYFLDNNVFVISEISQDIDEDDEGVPACVMEEMCAYTFKVHVIDLINNSRLVYESEPFEVVLAEFKPEL